MAGPDRRTVTSITARAHSDQRGAVSNWFVQLLIVVIVVGLIIYEAVALAFTTVRVDDLAREVARSARDEYRSEQSLDSARARAEELAADRDATVIRLDTEGDVLIVTLEKDANTLLVHRIPPLAERLTPSATRRAELRP